MFNEQTRTCVCIENSRVNDKGECECSDGFHTVVDQATQTRALTFSIPPGRNPRTTSSRAFSSLLGWIGQTLTGNAPFPSCCACSLVQALPGRAWRVLYPRRPGAAAGLLEQLPELARRAARR